MFQYKNHKRGFNSHSWDYKISAWNNKKMRISAKIKNK